jgi:hypothetical protein
MAREFLNSTINIKDEEDKTMLSQKIQQQVYSFYYWFSPPA